MASLSELSGSDLCDSCRQPAGELVNLAGGRLCEGCRVVLWTASILFDNDITDENEVVTTMAFAAYAAEGWIPAGNQSTEDLEELTRQYPYFELVKVVDDVPVLRLRPVVVNVVRYPGTEQPSKVLIEVLSEFVKPDTVAELYKQTLLEEQIHFHECGGGNVTWDSEKFLLSMSVGAKKELPSGRVGIRSEYPRGRIYSFPPPEIVRGFYETLLGSTDKRTFAGYAPFLGDHERPTPKTGEKTILACVAWYVGEWDDTVKPADRRPRVARTLNRHLLNPLGKPELPEDCWSPADTIWRDAQEVSQRFRRAKYFLQQPNLSKQHFQEIPV
jgi:hypothetical protein